MYGIEAGSNFVHRLPLAIWNLVEGDTNPQRSNRSARVAISSMPFSSSGLRVSNSCSSASVCRVRVLNPAPVAILHSASLSH